jgi:AraC-like DNA-binding protein
VGELARAAGLSCAHFSREFRRAFGESPHAYLLTDSAFRDPSGNSIRLTQVRELRAD